MREADAPSVPETQPEMVGAFAHSRENRLTSEPQVYAWCCRDLSQIVEVS